MMSHFLEWLLPKNPDNALARGRAGLVMAACLGLAIAVLALLLVWLISGDLQVETVVGSLVFILVLAGISALARDGRAGLAAWALIILLVLLITVDAASYGLGSPAAAAYFVPVVLAACSVGLVAGIGVALFCCHLGHCLGNSIGVVSAVHSSRAFALDLQRAVLHRALVSGRLDRWLLEPLHRRRFASWYERPGVGLVIAGSKTH